MFYFFLIAIKFFWKKKLRTFATIFGVVIGVIAIIILTSITSGIKKEFDKRINELGQDLITVQPEKTINNFPKGNLVLDDAWAIQERGQHIEFASPEINLSATYIYEKLFIQTNIKAVDSRYLDVEKDLNLECGRFLNSLDIIENKKVIVLGKDLSDYYFVKPEQALGKSININAVEYKVIGVLKSISVNDFINQENFNKLGFAPISTVLRENGVNTIQEINIRSTSKKSVDVAVEEIHYILEDRHGDKDFEVFTQEKLLEEINDNLKNLNMILFFIVSVAFLVGGVSIMNVMLLSVYERKKEISLRKALGAKFFDILWQFLIEAFFIYCIGGFLCISLGLLFVYLINNFLDFRISLELNNIILAVSFALFTSILFSFLPAFKAARLKPVQGLRGD